MNHAEIQKRYADANPPMSDQANCVPYDHKAPLAPMTSWAGNILKGPELTDVAKARAGILDQARAAVTVDRAATHGDAEQSFEMIAALWSTYLGQRITALQVAVMMTLFKCARQSGNASHLDNYVDAVGYMAIAGQMATTPSAKA